ncbi:MAG: hypothetical protein KAG43_06445 [Candidatus Marithrix sp.]|nr:hypothetical protein [Candidatus Marithrix sp.]
MKTKPAIGSLLLLILLFLPQLTMADPPSKPGIFVHNEGSVVTVNWYAENAEGYRLFYAPYPEKEPIESIEMGTRTEYSLRLPENSAYFVAVQAYNQDGNSPHSEEKYFILDEFALMDKADVDPDALPLRFDHVEIDGAIAFLPTEADAEEQVQRLRTARSAADRSERASQLGSPVFYEDGKIGLRVDIAQGVVERDLLLNFCLEIESDCRTLLVWDDSTVNYEETLLVSSVKTDVEKSLYADLLMPSEVITELRNLVKTPREFNLRITAVNSVNPQNIAVHAVSVPIVDVGGHRTRRKEGEGKIPFVGKDFGGDKFGAKFKVAMELYPYAGYKLSANNNKIENNELVAGIQVGPELSLDVKLFGDDYKLLGAGVKLTKNISKKLSYKLELTLLGVDLGAVGEVIGKLEEVYKLMKPVLSDESQKEWDGTFNTLNKYPIGTYCKGKNNQFTLKKKLPEAEQDFCSEVPDSLSERLDSEKAKPWFLNDVKFSDGGTATGSFEYIYTVNPLDPRDMKGVCKNVEVKVKGTLYGNEETTFTSKSDKITCESKYIDICESSCPDGSKHLRLTFTDTLNVQQEENQIISKESYYAKGASSQKVQKGSIKTEEEPEASLSLDLSFGTAVGYETTILVWVIPLKLSAGISGTLGVKGTGKLATNPTVLKIKAGPYGSLGAYASAGITVFVAEAGVKGTLTIIEEMIQANMQILITGTKPKYAGAINNILTGPVGNVSLYAKAYVPKVGTPPWEQKTWPLTLIDWKTFKRTDSLMTWGGYEETCTGTGGWNKDKKVFEDRECNGVWPEWKSVTVLEKGKGDGKVGGTVTAPSGDNIVILSKNPPPDNAEGWACFYTIIRDKVTNDSEPAFCYKLSSLAPGLQIDFPSKYKGKIKAVKIWKNVNVVLEKKQSGLSARQIRFNEGPDSGSPTLHDADFALTGVFGSDYDANAAEIIYTAKSAALNYGSGNAYLFRGSEYYQFNIEQGKATDGYPKLTKGDWTDLWSRNIDAAFILDSEWAYFFRGSEYVRYNLKKDEVDKSKNYPKSIGSFWPGVFKSDIDAVVNLDGKAYFFKGSEYVRYDLKGDKADENYPKPIKGHWGFPSSWHKNIDAAVKWGNGKILFFKGDEYISFDIKADKPDEGYPKPIEGIPGFSW